MDELREELARAMLARPGDELGDWLKNAADFPEQVFSDLADAILPIIERHQRSQKIADITQEVAPDLDRAVERLQAFADSQHDPVPSDPRHLSPDSPAICFSDVRAVLLGLKRARNEGVEAAAKVAEEYKRPIPLAYGVRTDVRSLLIAGGFIALALLGAGWGAYTSAMVQLRDVAVTQKEISGKIETLDAKVSGRLELMEQRLGDKSKASSRGQ